MGEYIERKALLNALKEERKNGNFVFTSKWIKEIMDDLPAAAVVPKSEVERLEAENLILKQKRLNLFDRLEFVKTARMNGAIEVIEYLENEGLLNMTPQGIAELKKKYTEGEG